MHCIEKVWNSITAHASVLHTARFLVYISLQLTFVQVLQPITDQLNMSICIGFYMFGNQVLHAWHHVIR